VGGVGGEWNSLVVWMMEVEVGVVVGVQEVDELGELGGGSGGPLGVTAALPATRATRHAAEEPAGHGFCCWGCCGCWLSRLPGAAGCNTWVWLLLLLEQASEAPGGESERKRSELGGRAARVVDVGALQPGMWRVVPGGGRKAFPEPVTLVEGGRRGFERGHWPGARREQGPRSGSRSRSRSRSCNRTARAVAWGTSSRGTALALAEGLWP